MSERAHVHQFAESQGQSFLVTPLEAWPYLYDGYIIHSCVVKSQILTTSSVNGSQCPIPDFGKQSPQTRGSKRQRLMSCCTVSPLTLSHVTRASGHVALNPSGFQHHLPITIRPCCNIRNNSAGSTHLTKSSCQLCYPSHSVDFHFSRVGFPSPHCASSLPGHLSHWQTSDGEWQDCHRG